jgi:membrane-associated protease RseP (regulator of RpoE activity)
MNVEEIIYERGRKILRGTLLIEADQAFESLKEKLKPFNLIPLLTENKGKVELQVRIPPTIKKNNLWINLILFLATICTTIVAGTFLGGANPFKEPQSLIIGIPFSFALLLILGAHELGHYFACRSEGIYATLPYFIPVPPPFFLGTFGAVIRIKSPIQTKKGLLKVGAAGPIIGFIVAIPVVIVGLKLSKFEYLLPDSKGIILGNSIIFWGLTKLSTLQPELPGYGLSLHPVAFAGWVGMFITAINLSPVGQLDGGHISYALFGKKSKFIAIPFLGIILILATLWLGWLVWTFVVFIVIGIKHPPPLNDISSLNLVHKIIGIIALLIFVITFVPLPFRVCG